MIFLKLILTNILNLILKNIYKDLKLFKIIIKKNL